jgi:hypothetical protein
VAPEVNGDVDVVLAWIHGRRPALADLDILKGAFPSSANLPDDELACQVIHDLNGRICGKPSQVETAPPVMDQVA